MNCVRREEGSREVVTKTFGSRSGYSVQQTADDGYIIVGDSIRFDASLVYDIYLIKTESDGNEIWSNTFDIDERDFGYSIQATKDGGYIIVGETGYYDYGMQSDIPLIYYKPDPELVTPTDLPSGGDSGGGDGGGGGGG